MPGAMTTALVAGKAVELAAILSTIQDEEERAEAHATFNRVLGGELAGAALKFEPETLGDRMVAATAGVRVGGRW